MRSKLPLLGATVLLAIGCGPATVPCGSFTFTGTPHSDHGITNTVSFSFDPAACGARACNCNTICYIQIVRIYDMQDGTYLQPHSEQTNRMVTGNPTPAFNGWAVDRLAGRTWGYYGRNNDGTFASTLTTGGNTSPAILRDRPSGWPEGSWFDAVSVPVCIDSDSGCVNRLLGYEYWLFVVGNDGTVGTPFSEIGRDWHADVFDLAVNLWNTQAASLGRNSFPALSRLP